MVPVPIGVTLPVTLVTSAIFVPVMEINDAACTVILLVKPTKSFINNTMALVLLKVASVKLIAITVR